jgi:asparagine synthase (glutamine-hydrolysing)
MKGNWALLLADFQEGFLLGAVDRWGTRPLYCWEGPDGLYFASEIKAFKAHPAWDPRPERQSAYEFLNWGISDHTERTFYDGVFRFPQGEWVRFRFNASSWRDGRRQKWFTPVVGGFTGSFNDAVEEFRPIFQRAVSRRMTGGRQGYAISGGLDSSSVACTAAKLAPKAHREGFFIRTPFPGHDETEYAKGAAEAAGCPLTTEAVFLEGFLEDLDTVIADVDEPFRTARFYIHYLLCRLMHREGIRVAMEGQGGMNSWEGISPFFYPVSGTGSVKGREQKPSGRLSRPIPGWG